jgi:hypothetical protein
MKNFLAHSGALTGLVVMLALPVLARADAPANMGPPIPPNLLPPQPTFSISHPPPPNLQPVAPGTDVEAVNPTLAPAPESRQDGAIGSVTCFACPDGQDTFHGAICMNGVACAAEGVTLQQLNIGVDRTSTPITTALRTLEAARAEISKMKGPSRGKALQYLNTAVTQLKAAGLRAGCKAPATPATKSRHRTGR